jgi:hypothetical protein
MLAKKISLLALETGKAAYLFDCMLLQRIATVLVTNDQAHTHLLPHAHKSHAKLKEFE